MRHVLTCGAALLAAGIAARPASAQQLEDAALRVAAEKAEYLRGMSPVGQPFTGRLAGTTSTRFRVMLRGGTAYALDGRCDAACHDLDLRLIGPDGGEVAADVERDAEPMVRVVPRQSGSYELRAYMADCRQASCTFTVRLMSRAANARDD